MASCKTDKVSIQAYNNAIKLKAYYKKNGLRKLLV